MCTMRLAMAELSVYIMLRKGAFGLHAGKNSEYAKSGPYDGEQDPNDYKAS